MTDAPRETELKLVLSPGEAARVATTPPLAGVPPRRDRFMAFYFDTPARDLARNGLGLRLRREGRYWRATLKARGSSAGGLHQRPEWEYPASGAILDLSRFAGTPLADLPGAETLHRRLVPVLVTDFSRTRWLLEPQPGTRLEVALDEGHLRARRRTSAIQEVEIELLSGHVSAAFDVAEALASAIALRPEPASKLARGLSLASTARARPVHATAVNIKDAKDARAVAQRLAAACLAQAQANEAGVLHSADIEFVHQLRVALRRLRSALRLCRRALDPGECATFADDLRWAAAVLGRCRDWDVFVTETLPSLIMAQGDAQAGRDILRRARAQQRQARRAAREVVLSGRYGMTMVRLARWLSESGPAPAGTAPPPEFASARLRKGAKRIAADSAAYPTLDAPARHALRILVKRQRYATEFLGSLFRGQAVKRHVNALSEAQDALGLANDCANAMTHVRELAPTPGFVEFARGWFAAREATGIEAAHHALRRVAREPRFWRRKPKHVRAHPRLDPEQGT